MIKSFKINELGRSMVEMLGILAVIGVLSIGAIQGYKYAFNKYNVNETINELNLRANDISQRMERLIELHHAGEINMEMGPTMRTGYPIRARMSPQYTDYFEIFVSEVPSDVCKLLLQSQWQAPYSIFVGITEYKASVDICGEAEKVELAYEFHKDLLQAENIKEEERHEIMRCRHSNDCNCGTCNTQTGLCETECNANQKCVKDFNEPEWMMCCNKENIVGSYCCVYVSENGECCDWEGKCCPPEKPLMGTNGTCYSCDTPNVVTVSNTNRCTSVCPNRFINSTADKKCILCGVAGTSMENKPLYNYQGNCYSCDYNQGFDMGNHLGATFWKKCASTCDNRRPVNGMCYPACSGNTPLMGEDGKCYSCDDETHTIKIESLTDTCENLCPNRKTENGYCNITCPPDKPLQAANGKCYSCDDTTIVTVSDVSSCSICPKRFINSTADKKCILCGVAGTSMENKPLYNYQGNCYSCDYNQGFDMGNHLGATFWKKCAETCNNRRAIKSICYPACSGDTPLMGEDGKCYGCDDETHAIKTSSLTDACENLCPNRKTENGYCNITCPSDKPLQDANGKCYSCDDTTIVTVSDISTCNSICSKRFVNNDTDKKCILCGVSGTIFENKPLYDYQGNCYSCDYDKYVDLGNHVKSTFWKKCTEICSNRYSIRSVCYPKCPEETPLTGTDGKCYDCNYSGKTLSSPCSDVCSNRELDAQKAYCVRTYCVDGTFADKNGICQICNIQSLIETSEDECRKCVNRSYKDGYCYPPTTS